MFILNRDGNKNKITRCSRAVFKISNNVMVSEFPGAAENLTFDD